MEEFVEMGSPIKGEVKLKNTSPCKIKIDFFLPAKV